jgi:cobalt-zinc-cadmium efflux system outer membrane protein
MKIRTRIRTCRAVLPAALAGVLLATAGPALAQQHDHSAPERETPTAQTPEQASPRASPAKIRLDELEQLAARNSPAIRQAEANVRAAEGRARQAGLYPNPVVGYTADEIRTGDPHEGGKHGFFVDQTIVLGGKLGRRRDLFLAAVREAEAALAAQRAVVANTVRLRALRALAAERRVELSERLARLVDEAVATSYGLFNVGQADKPDVLEIEIEQRQAQLDLLEARNDYGLAWQQLAAAVGNPELPVSAIAATFDEALPNVDPAALLPEILSNSPQVQVARARVERARAGLGSARAERVPDLVVSGGMRYNREFRDVTGGRVGWEPFVDVGVEIPLFNRNQGNIHAAESEIEIAEAELRLVELGLRSQFSTVYTRFQNARRIAETYKTEIIPRAETAYRLYLDKYRQMTAAYPQVLIARRTVLQVNLDYIAAIEGLWDAVFPLRGFLLAGDTSGSRDFDAPLALPGAGRGAAEDPR